MNYKLLIVLFFSSISVFGQDKISLITIENISSHLWSNTTIYIGPDTKVSRTQKNKILVEIEMNLKEDRNYKKIKYIDQNDFEVISTILLTLNAKDLFPELGCLDGNHTTINFNNTNNSVEYKVSCSKNNTNFHQVLKFILDKINLKETDFYR